MDFDLTETQSILLNSARSFLAKEAKDLFREVEKTDEGYSKEIWQKMAELGWLGVVFPEEYGGIEGSFLDLVLILEEMGKVLFPGPFIPTVISGLAILDHGTGSQKDDLLPNLIEGKLLLSPALIKPNPAVAAIEQEDEVGIKNGNYTLSGTRLFVPFAHVTDMFIYGAVMEKGTTLFLMDAKNSGISPVPLNAIGADKPCEVKLDGVKMTENDILGVIEKGDEIVRKMEERGALAEGAFMLGMLEQVLKLSVEYAKEREQFERKIGSFQAIQHQCANMATDVDQVKFLIYEAAWKLGQNLPAKKEISMAKAWASDASRRVSLLGVKIHGGTGVSEEHDMQFYFRRAKACEVAYGDGDFHREVVAQELGL